MTPKQETNAAQRREIAQWLQIVVLLIAVGGVFMKIGQRDEQLQKVIAITEQQSQIITQLTIGVETLRQVQTRMQIDLDRMIRHGGE